MKQKEHRFTIIVKRRDPLASQSRGSAEVALLAAFARRQPDGQEFHLLKKRPKVEKRK